MSLNKWTYSQLELKITSVGFATGWRTRHVRTARRSWWARARRTRNASCGRRTPAESWRTRPSLPVTIPYVQLHSLSLLVKPDEPHFFMSRTVRHKPKYIWICKHFTPVADANWAKCQTGLQQNQMEMVSVNPIRQKVRWQLKIHWCANESPLFSLASWLTGSRARLLRRLCMGLVWLQQRRGLRVYVHGYCHLRLGVQPQRHSAQLEDTRHLPWVLNRNSVCDTRCSVAYFFHVCIHKIISLSGDKPTQQETPDIVCETLQRSYRASVFCAFPYKMLPCCQKFLFQR